MTAPAAKPRMTYAEYLERERTSEIKHEFIHGEMFAMAGGTRNHANVQMGLYLALGKALDGSTCRPAGADARMYFPAYDEGAYPDATIVCGPYRFDPVDKDGCINPVAVFEVLSPGTEAWDRGGKFERYESLPTLREYVLVTPDKPRVELFRRNDNGTWTRWTFGAGERVPLESAGIEIPVDDLYALQRAEDAQGA